MEMSRDNDQERKESPHMKNSRGKDVTYKKCVYK